MAWSLTIFKYLKMLWRRHEVLLTSSAHSMLLFSNQRANYAWRKHGSFRFCHLDLGLWQGKGKLRFHVASHSKESACNAGDLVLIPGLGRSPGEGNGKPTPVFLPGESQGQRSLVGHSPWGWKDLNTTEQFTLGKKRENWDEKHCSSFSYFQ